MSTFGLAVRLRHLPDRRGPAGSCWRLVRHRSWPESSTRAGRGPMGTRASASCSVFLFFRRGRGQRSYFVQVQSLPWEAFVCAVPVACWRARSSSSQRPRPRTDRRAGKRTLAVRLGRERRGRCTSHDARTCLPHRAPAWALGSMTAGCLLAVPRHPLAVKVTAAGARHGRWAVAERGPGRGRAAAAAVFCVLFRGGDPRQRWHRPVKLERMRHTLRLRTPLHTAYGEVAERELISISLTDADGRRERRGGPAGGIRGPRAPTWLFSARVYRPMLRGSRRPDRPQLIEAAASDRRPRGPRGAHLALWDRAGRRAGKARIADLINRRPAASVPVNAGA